MKLLNNIKNVKRNFQTIQSSPYASLHFKYRITLITISLFSAYIAYVIIQMTLNYQGYGWQTWIMRGFTLGIGALIISKAFQTLDPIKRAMEPYKKKKELINHTETDAKIEINDILKQFNDDGKRKDNINLGKRELNSMQKK